jgi:uncharacterized protein YigA (DUF484 family)
MNSTHSSHFKPDRPTDPDHPIQPGPIITGTESAYVNIGSPEAEEFLASPDLPPPLPEQSRDVESDPNTVELLKSFDMLFRLHQRSEDIRSYLDKIDRILLTARSVSALAGQVVEALERDLDLAAVRIHFPEDGPFAALLQWSPPRGVMLSDSCFPENGGLPDAGPFVLDDPSGDLAESLFSDAAHLVASAAVAPLFAHGRELGMLCLGSEDPLRYCGGMNTDLIASLANKIALGIMNARDHERRGTEAFTTEVEGVVTDSFLHLILEREFDRAWRYGRPFTVAAIRALSFSPDPPPSTERLAALLKKDIRSSDLIAADREEILTLLLPETTATLAVRIVDRLRTSLRAEFSDGIELCAGITEFSQSAPVAAIILNEARAALSRASEPPAGPTLVSTVPEPPSPGASPRPSGPHARTDEQTVSDAQPA